MYRNEDAVERLENRVTVIERKQREVRVEGLWQIFVTGTRGVGYVLAVAIACLAVIGIPTYLIRDCNADMNAKCQQACEAREFQVFDVSSNQTRCICIDPDNGQMGHFTDHYTTWTTVVERSQEQVQ